MNVQSVDQGLSFNPKAFLRTKSKKYTFPSLWEIGQLSNAKKIENYGTCCRCGEEEVNVHFMEKSVLAQIHVWPKEEDIVKYWMK